MSAPTAYLDTSALGRVLLGEPEAPAILAALAGFERLVSSRLLRLELRRLAQRKRLTEDADRLLSGVALLPVDDELLEFAGVVAPASVHALDAIHLVTALRMRDAGVLDAVITYDAQLAEGARHHGLTTLTP